MKKLLGYIGAHMMFYIGHIISIPMVKFDIPALYGIYTSFMSWSAEIHDWAELESDLWTKIENDDESN